MPARLDGVKVGVYTGLAGLDRLGLSRLLRAANARVEVVASAEALTDALRAGRIDAGVSEALMARQIAGTLGLQVAWMPAPLARYPVAFGLWKGDLTLKRRLATVIDGLEGEGLTRELAGRYRIAPIGATVSLD
jgi:polar amino acid transport system substrate-binding protein/cystine transport system substrate-binding protein/membrane-bound lytic murein transglycosylase F